MARVENSIDSKLVLGTIRVQKNGFINSLIHQITDFLFIKGNIFPMMGFLLGRAVVLSSFSPFSLPFFASIFFVRKDQAKQVFITLALGALTLRWSESATLLVGTSTFLLIRKIHNQTNEKKAKHFPLYVFVSAFLSRFLAKLFWGQISGYLMHYISALKPF